MLTLFNLPPGYNLVFRFFGYASLYASLITASAVRLLVKFLYLCGQYTTAIHTP